MMYVLLWEARDKQVIGSHADYFHFLSEEKDKTFFFPE